MFKLSAFTLLAVTVAFAQPVSLSSLTDYCNFPENIKVKEELLPSAVLTENHLSLESVITLIRHGDRGPLWPVTGFKDIPLNRPEGLVIDHQLQTTLDTFHTTTEKHLNSLENNLKPPFNPSPSRSNRMSHLTVLGSLQLLKQGQELAGVYLPEMEEGKSMESLVQRLEAYTTNFERTFQSETSLLYGLLTKIQSTTPDGVLCELLKKIQFTDGIYFCMDKKDFIEQKEGATLDKLLNQLEQEELASDSDVNQLMSDVMTIISPPDSELNDEERERKEKITKLAPDLPISIIVTDGLMAYLCHATPFPSRDGRSVTKDDAERIMAFVEAQNKRLSKDHSFLQHNMLKIYGYLQFLVKRFKQIANVEETYPRFSLFSGHDFTLISVASVLGFWDYQMPPYASRVVFEVYRQQDNPTAYVRILYNGKDVTENTDVCKKSPEGESPSSNCMSFSGEKSNSFTVIPSNEFESFVSTRFNQLATTDNFKSLKRQRDEAETDPDPESHQKVKIEN